MNILIVYPHGNALTCHSGAETRIYNIIDSLINNNFDVLILHSIKSIGFEDKDLKARCKVFYYRDFNFFGWSDWYFSDINPFYIFKVFQILRSKNLDIIQVEFPWGFLTIKLFAKKKNILIYDSLGVESEFMNIAVNHPKFPKIFKVFAPFFAKLYEKLVCKFADVIINISEVDRNYYIKNYKIKRSKTFFIPASSSIKAQNSLGSEILKIKYRKKLGLPVDKTIVIFHGGLPHPPNQEAFDLIKNFISPRINNPDILFVLAGYNLEKFKKKNLISLGFIKDLKDLLYSADFAIVPIISGSGMRIKCADYITSALPFISTRKGIEGINFLKNGEDCLLYDKVDKRFLEGINIFYKNRSLRHKIQENLMKKSVKISQKNIGNRFIKLYLRLTKN